MSVVGSYTNAHGIVTHSTYCLGAVVLTYRTTKRSMLAAGCACSILCGKLSAYLKDQRLLARIAQAEDLAYFLVERACLSQNSSQCLAPRQVAKFRDARLKPSSGGSSSMDMVIVRA